LVKTTDYWSYSLPTKIVFGTGSINKVPEIVSPFSPEKIILVTGSQSMKKFGFCDKILERLKTHRIVVYDGVSHNPTSTDIEEGARFLRKEKCDLVIGLGGGSVIDFAKAAAVFSKNLISVSDYLSGKIEIANVGIPVIAIPTTAGTGSEVTQYASIIQRDAKKKISLTHEFLRPTVAMLDPSLTLTMPAFIAATTGLDALSQCIEAYWSKNHTPISDVFALKGLKLILKSLVETFDSPDKIDSKSDMLLGSLFSGLAISVAKTTIVHSVSYPLTVHFGVPHGLACSLTLPSFIRYNSMTDEGRILNMVNAVGFDTIEDFSVKIKDMINKLKLPTKLSEVGIGRGNIELIVEEGFRPDRAANNPREVTTDNLREILNSIL
jgi:phosphonate metabolism-associated iron-containing alcohol dehydrogenase